MTAKMKEQLLRHLLIALEVHKQTLRLLAFRERSEREVFEFFNSAQSDYEYCKDAIAWVDVQEVKP